MWDDLPEAKCPNRSNQFDHEEAGENKADNPESIESIHPAFPGVVVLASEDGDNEVYLID